MTDTRLKRELDRLRSEIKDLAPDNIEAREKLDLLISDIEKKVEEPSNENHHTTLIEDLKEAIAQFETEHPRATAILNDIMVTLSNMGI
jgi:predicted  nucleic acid-binding Zn-ribbon protein